MSTGWSNTARHARDGLNQAAGPANGLLWRGTDEESRLSLACRLHRVSSRSVLWGADTGTGAQGDLDLSGGHQAGSQHRSRESGAWVRAALGEEQSRSFSGDGSSVGECDRSDVLVGL